MEELRAAARELKVAKAEYGKGAFGFNLIVNKSNPKAAKQLDALCEEGCDFLITSLGSPEETDQARARGRDQGLLRCHGPAVRAKSGSARVLML
jgi:nitronate monooxygenase